MALPVFDLHCDALQRSLDMGHDLGGETPGHFDLAKAARGGVRAISLTAWIDSPYADEPGAAKRRTNALLDAADDLFERHPDRVRRVEGAVDLEALPDGVVGCSRHRRRARHRGGPRAAEHTRRGVRVMTLRGTPVSWARSCQEGAPAGTPEGLSAFGREVVTRMGELGMRADLSHAAERTFYDALECEGPAPLVTHSGCKALSNHPRNVTDDQLRALAARGGVLGIPFATAFLDEKERAAEQAFRRTDAYRDAGRGGATEAHMHHGDAIQSGLGPFPIEHVVRHALHALEVAGPAHVAIGSDFDGIDRRPAGLEDASGYPALLSALADAGVDEDTVAAVAYGNAARALADAQPRRAPPAVSSRPRGRPPR